MSSRLVGVCSAFSCDWYFVQMALAWLWKSALDRRPPPLPPHAERSSTRKQTKAADAPRIGSSLDGLAVDEFDVEVGLERVRDSKQRVYPRGPPAAFQARDRRLRR